MTTWSIGEAAAKCGLSQHTLRWYERIGLLGQNVAALDITLTPGELAQLGPLAAQVTGARY